MKLGGESTPCQFKHFFYHKVCFPLPRQKIYIFLSIDSVPICTQIYNIYQEPIQDYNLRHTNNSNFEIQKLNKIPIM